MRTGSRQARPSVTPALVESAVPATLRSATNALEWLWGGLGPAERIVASALAGAGPGAITQEELERRLQESGVRILVGELRDAPAPSKMGPDRADRMALPLPGRVAAPLDRRAQASVTGATGDRLYPASRREPASGRLTRSTRMGSCRRRCLCCSRSYAEPQPPTGHPASGRDLAGAKPSGRSTATAGEPLPVQPGSGSAAAGSDAAAPGPGECYRKRSSLSCTIVCWRWSRGNLKRSRDDVASGNSAGTGQWQRMISRSAMQAFKESGSRDNLLKAGAPPCR